MGDIKYTLGCIRRADADFGMIKPGDTVLAGVSGGKDSLLLLYALSLYRRFAPAPFTLIAATLTLGIEPFDVSGITALCAELGVPYTVKPTRIGPIIFDERGERNPCALCSRMRHGVLNRVARELGANVVAYGHHADDAVETLLMSILYEGRMHTFKPVTELTRAGLRLIRPMLYLPEQHIIKLTRRLALPVVPNPCPANGNTQRARMKTLVDDLCAVTPDAREKLLAALRNKAQYGLWD